MKKLILAILATAIILSGSTNLFAAPKQTVKEPIYFTLATGQE